LQRCAAAVPRKRVFQLGLAMTLPEHIWFAAREGDLDTIRAYFEDDSDGARDVDDVFENVNNLTPLIQCARGNDLRHLTLEHVEVARYLLSRGASIDEKTLQGQTALLASCYTSGGTVAEMVELLLSAGADPNARNIVDRTAISAHMVYCETPSLECVTSLLRAGASLDRVYIENAFEYHSSEFSPAMRALVAGVRRAGSFKSYCREPHREVLLLRGLAMRGHLMPRRRTRGTAEWTAAVAFLARLGDNGVVWNVLSFWRDAGARRTKTV
jgi:hypothetical protein